MPIGCVERRAASVDGVLIVLCHDYLRHLLKAVIAGNSIHPLADLPSQISIEEAVASKPARVTVTPSP